MSTDESVQFQPAHGACGSCITSRSAPDPEVAIRRECCSERCAARLTLSENLQPRMSAPAESGNRVWIKVAEHLAMCDRIPDHRVGKALRTVRTSPSLRLLSIGTASVRLVLRYAVL